MPALEFIVLALAGTVATSPSLLLQDRCKAPDCLFQFGPACDANKTPPVFNTSDIARTKLGQVEYGGPGIYSCVNPGVVALTYDDGPASYTDDLLDLLKKYNAKATFMVTGNNNAKRETDNAMFPWASHIWSHADLCKINSAQRKNETPPYSSCTTECGCEDDMKDLGYSVIYFDLDTADYLHDSQTGIQKSKEIVDQSIKAKPAPSDNFLVIGHDIHRQTVYNLTEYILQKFQGRKLVTIGECLGDPKGNCIN
ncbi:glycoside hydrolase/deacetylase [Colletotrichum caudatum]|nr:glycoside hydrolase/deacetylase [Colletotrichum caudatum]